MNKVGMSMAELIHGEGVKEIVTMELILGTAMNKMLPGGTKWQREMHPNKL